MGTEPGAQTGEETLPGSQERSRPAEIQPGPHTGTVWRAARGPPRDAPLDACPVAAEKGDASITGEVVA